MRKQIKKINLIVFLFSLNFITHYSKTYEINSNFFL